MIFHAFTLAGINVVFSEKIRGFLNRLPDPCRLSLTLADWEFTAAAKKINIIDAERNFFIGAKFCLTWS
jgi:hypothetical protein